MSAYYSGLSPPNNSKHSPSFPPSAFTTTQRNELPSPLALKRFGSIQYARYGLSTAGSLWWNECLRYSTGRHHVIIIVVCVGPYPSLLLAVTHRQTGCAHMRQLMPVVYRQQPPVKQDPMEHCCWTNRSIYRLQGLKMQPITAVVQLPKQNWKCDFQGSKQSVLSDSCSTISMAWSSGYTSYQGILPQLPSWSILR